LTPYFISIFFGISFFVRIHIAFIRRLIDIFQEKSFKNPKYKQAKMFENIIVYCMAALFIAYFINLNPNMQTLVPKEEIV
jgi:hypothetical protein